MTLRLEGVSKIFYDRKSGRGVVALNDVNLEIENNEFLVIIGPSGCGKSTIINLVAGFDRPTQGKVLMNGDSIIGPSPDRGVVFQDHSLFPWMTSRENVEFGLGSNGIKPARRREICDRYLEMVGLLDFSEARPNELSGGMRQKLAVIRTLALNPDILLMDEPFGSLDEGTRRKMDLDLLNIWRRERKTVIFVTHNLEEAVMLGDRVVLMSSHPGTILSEWRIHGGHPRDPMAPCMCEIKREISSKLAVNCDEKELKDHQGAYQEASSPISTAGGIYER